MALIVCQECSKDISTMASSCPHCGYPITNSPELGPQLEQKQLHSVTNCKTQNDLYICIAIVLLTAVIVGGMLLKQDQYEKNKWSELSDKLRRKGENDWQNTRFGH